MGRQMRVSWACAGQPPCIDRQHRRSVRFPVMPNALKHTWEFKARFRRHAFGWKSRPAITRITQAVAEIRKVAKTSPVLAGEGAVVFLERISPALERVDSSSGAIGSTVNKAVAELVKVIASAPADVKTREAWLDRLFEASQADEVPYIESLADEWGELCSSKRVASVWADRLIGITSRALSPDKDMRGHFHGTSACLSALYRAERFDELIELLRADTIWPYKRWAVKAMAAKNDKAEAIRYAESCRSPWANDGEINSICEEILLSSGRHEEAYERYGVRAHWSTTYLATFRAIAKRYPHKSADAILADLVKSTPGEEGKWFAAAKEAGLYVEALALARRTPCDPRTLTRAARDYSEKDAAFAVGAGEAALRWLVLGHGYEITSADVLEAYRSTMAAAHLQGNAPEVEQRIRALIASPESCDSAPAVLLRKVLGA